VRWLAVGQFEDLGRQPLASDLDPGQELGKSQSAISQSVRGLEERLKLRLLTRTTRSVMPTPAGEQLLRALRPALDEIEAQLNALRELRELPSGSLRRYPDIKVEVSIGPALTDIVNEQYDAGVRRGEQIARDMIALRIGPDLRMVVVGCPGYLAEHGIPVEPQELTHHRCCNIRSPTSGGLYAWEFERDGRRVNVHVDGPFVLNDMHLLIDAALHGAGLAMVMEDMVTPFIADGRLVRVLEDWSPPLSGYHLYYPHRRHPSPAFAALLEEPRASSHL
jgi:DNA-binding transcriptional LysR family regulator